MQTFKKILSYLTAQKVSLYAANAGYFLILSVFPSLVVLLAMLRYTGLQVDIFTELLEGVIPNALLPAAKRLILSAYVNSTGAVLSLSAVAALWSAGRGVHGLLIGLNNIYEVKEDRGYLKTRLLSMVYMFAFLLVLLLTLVLHIWGGDLLRFLRAFPIPEFVLNVLDLRFFVLLVLQTALFSAVYTMLPNRQNRWKDSLPGALLASIGWQVFTNLYSIYAQKVTTYANIYGSVYAVALSMLWLYFCLCILFYGGVLNRFLQKNK